MKKGVYLIKSAKETQKIAEKMAKEVLTLQKARNKNKKAVIIALEGNLGSGKTTFLQGFAKGLGIKEKITSPTFVILKKFPISNSKFFYHIDCYRIKGAKDLLNLSWRDIIKNPENIVAVEWSEKIKKLLPKEAIKLKFRFIDPETREILCPKKKSD